jgi:hypothetical protein
LFSPGEPSVTVATEIIALVSGDSYQSLLLQSFELKMRLEGNTWECAGEEQLEGEEIEPWDISPWPHCISSIVVNLLNFYELNNADDIPCTK